MQFNTSNRRTPYFSQREQRRMLAMAMTLVFVIVAIQWSAQPENWHWIAPPNPEEQAESQGRSDDRLRGSPAKEPLPHDVFIARADINGLPKAPNDEVEETIPSDSETETDPADTATKEADPQEQAQPKSIVDRAFLQPLFKDVSDNSLGVRPAELEAFYATLKFASQLTADELKQARKDVSFTNLQAEPEAFRGELIRFDGEALRILSIDGSDNDYGFANFFEAWIQTRDSGNDLYRVVFLQTGESLSVGSDVSVPVTVTGIFFKRQGYNSVNGQNVAPLILAHKLTRTAYQPSEVADESLAPYVIGFATFVGVSAMIAVWFYSRGDRKFEKEGRHKYTEASDEALDTLKQLSESD